MARLLRPKLIVGGLAAVLVLLIILVAMLPTLVSLGLGRGAIEQAAAARVRGDVTIDDMSLGWFSAQSVRGLRIVDETGREAANLDASLGAGLVSLLFGPADTLRVEVSGALEGELREDGSTSFGELFEATNGEASGNGGEPRPEKPQSPPDLAGVPPISVSVDGLRVVLELEGDADQAPLIVEELKGRLEYAPGGKFELKLASPTTSGDLRGSVELSASGAGLFDADGLLTSAGAVAEARLVASGLPVPYAEEARRLEHLDVELRTSDLSKSLDVAMEVTVDLGGAEVSRLDGDVSLREPVTADGRINVGLDTVSADVTGQRVPAPLFQPLVAGGVIDLRRDVGPLVDVSAKLGGAPGDDSSAIDLSLSGARAQLEIAADVTPEGAVDGERMKFEAMVQPELVAALAGERSVVNEPFRVEAEARSFHLPARDEGGTIPIEQATFDVSLSVPDPVRLVLGDEPAKSVETRGLRFDVASDGLASGMRVDGSVGVGDGSFAARLVAALIDRDGARALRVSSAELNGKVTPALAALLRADSDDEAFTLESPFDARVTLEPFDLPATPSGGYALPETPIRGRVEVPRAALRHPALSEPVRVEDLAADLSATTGADAVYAVQGAGTLSRTATDDRLAQLRFDLTARTEGETLVPGGSITLDNLAVGGFETVLDMAPGAVAGWVGSSGALTVELVGGAAAQEVTVRSDLSRVRGALVARLEEEIVTLRSDELDMTFDRAALASVLIAPPEDEAEPTMTISEDVPFRASLSDVRVPLAAGRGEAFDPAQALIDVTLAGGPLTFADASGVIASLGDLDVTLRTKDLAQGVRFKLRGTAAGRGDAAPGRLEIDGSVVDLVTEASTLDSAAAKLTMNATVEQVPTVIADAILGLDGMLVAAVGAEMGATFKSSKFSRASGWLEARVDTPQGFVDGRLVTHENGVRTTKARPLHAELALTPAFSERLLEPIHPLLADVRTTEQPIRLAVGPGAIFPLDGDLSQLKANIEITIGAVEFDSGSTLLTVLSLFNNSPKETIPGSIEPIRAKIRKGVVTYDRFAVHIDKNTLVYTGRVDLVAKTIDLRTEIPLSGLAMSIKELRGYADDIVVPIVTRGTFDKNKTEIDPSFDLGEAAIQAGFRGALDEFLKGKGGGQDLGGLLDDLLRGDRKKNGN